MTSNGLLQSQQIDAVLVFNLGLDRPYMESRCGFTDPFNIHTAGISNAFPPTISTCSSFSVEGISLLVSWRSHLHMEHQDRSSVHGIEQESHSASLLITVT
ncbi:hypothetical protein EYF80_007665 [Liparis tanakae]|uniref:Uncharacterized protein n=1 Tax=Liparis tanakae TaxID=230148 RepID=A0A4Z2IVJ2_9TELE|nr:hypothetical protein EYF80_007665 [Liparis tanakae]